MNIKLSDIPSLEGLHFVLKPELGDGVLYRIGRLGEGDRIGRVHITWGNPEVDYAWYPVKQFVEYINDGSWIITDLPSVDFDSLDLS